MKKRTRGQEDKKRLDNVPRVTLTLTDETIWLTRHDRSGAPAATYPVQSADVAAAFNEFGASTGLLPANTLFWQSVAGQTRIGIWLPPKKRILPVATGHGLQYWTIPLPGFIFVGQARTYFIYAALKRPGRSSDRLYRCPLPNVYTDGRICAGNVAFPVCAGDTIDRAAAQFFESEFNHDLVGGDLLKFLRSLQGEAEFPSGRLQPSMALAEVMGGKHSNVWDGLVNTDEDDAIDDRNLDLWMGDADPEEFYEGIASL